MDPHSRYDVLAQPSISDADLSVLHNAMKAACVEVKTIAQTPANEGWRTNPTHEGESWVTEVPFVHNLDAGQIVANAGSGRDVKPDADDDAFWVVQAVAAYEHGEIEFSIEGENYTVNADYDSSVIISGKAYSLPAFGRQENFSTIYVFCETIRDVSAHQALLLHNGQTIANLYRNSNALMQGTVLHETLHCFELGDNGNGIMSSPSASNMTAGGVFGYHETFAGLWNQLLPEHIMKIQEATRPQ